MRNEKHRGSPVIAVLVAGWAAGWSGAAKFTEPSTDFAFPLASLLAVVGVVAAVGIWRGDAWCVRVYTGWAIANVIALGFVDAQVEPLWWKVALGVTLAAILLVAVGLRLRARQMENAT